MAARRRALRIALPLGCLGAASLALGACGSGQDGSQATTAARQAATVTCPGKAGSEPFNIANNLQRDLTFSASAPNCSVWGSKPPAAFNGRDIPSRAAGDPESRFYVSGVEYRSSRKPVPTRLTFTGSDGNVVAQMDVRFHPNNTTYGLDLYDGKTGAFVRDTPVVVGKTTGGTVQAVALSGGRSAMNGPGPGLYRLVLQWAR